MKTCFQICKRSKTYKHQKALLKISKKRILIKETDETLSKKIKLDKETLIKSTLKSHTNSDITSQEIKNFLRILNVVINQIENEGKSINQETDAEDGTIDILVTIGEEIYKFLQQDIDSLDLPEIIKKALKAIVTFVRAIKNHGQNYSCAKKKSKDSRLGGCSCSGKITKIRWCWS